MSYQSETEVEDPQDTPQVESDAGSRANQRGIDVSNWQGVIDWPKVAKAGIKHVFMKMTEGATFVDPKFVTNWNGATKAGLKVNCYHYFRATPTAEAQMENIRKNSRAVNFDPAKNSLAIDVEAIGNENATPDQMADKLSALLALIKKDSVLGKKPVLIYTSPGYWNSKVKYTKYDFSGCPIWVAHWGVSSPTLPQPWKNANKPWAWWQYSSTGRVDGIGGNVDLDWVNV